MKRALLVLIAAVALFDAAGREPEVAHFVGHVAHAMAVK